jgi:hypothetical protein
LYECATEIGEPRFAAEEIGDGTMRLLSLQLTLTCVSSANRDDRGDGTGGVVVFADKASRGTAGGDELRWTASEVGVSLHAEANRLASQEHPSK